MRRERHAPRRNWQRRMETELGFQFHTIGGEPYWTEDAFWRLTAAEVDLLDDVSTDLHIRALGACAHVVDKGLLPALGIDGAAAAAVSASWEQFAGGRGEMPVYGRLDLAWDGQGAPKLLEYNGSTPTALFESAVVQWHWLQEWAPEADQFNSIHEALVERWREAAAWYPSGRVVFATQDNPEDRGTAAYMAATAIEAGLATKVIDVAQIGYDPAEQRFFDPDQEWIDVLWSLYPPEWLIRDEFGTVLLDALIDRRLVLVEPFWKLMLTKGILPVLHTLNPHHPNILRAAATPTGFRAGDRIVAKPLFGREGDGVEIATLGSDGRPQGPVTGADRPRFAGTEGYIYQDYAPLLHGPGGHVVLGTWLIGDRCCGLGIREDGGLITGNGARFTPHLFKPEA